MYPEVAEEPAQEQSRTCDDVIADLASYLSTNEKFEEFFSESSVHGRSSDVLAVEICERFSGDEVLMDLFSELSSCGDARVWYSAVREALAHRKVAVSV